MPITATSGIPNKRQATPVHGLVASVALARLENVPMNAMAKASQPIPNTRLPHRQPLAAARGMSVIASPSRAEDHARRLWAVIRPSVTIRIAGFCIFLRPRVPEVVTYRTG
jgi:hypothetical protein